MTSFCYLSNGNNESFYGLIFDTVSLIPALKDYKTLFLAVI